MGIFSWLFGQFIDIIEWQDDTNNTLVWRFPRGDNEIKYGAKLIVRESQVAVFMDKGIIADILGPGTYELETSNLPILTDLQHWDHGFESPFKAEVYFVSTKLFRGLKWGTKNPIILRDSEFDIVRLKAFGTYDIKVKDPKKFLNEIVGTDGHFTTEEISDYLANLIVTNLADVLGHDKRSILDLAASYDDFAKYIKENLKDKFENIGLSLEDVYVENISLPKEVEEAIDKRGARKATGDLDEHLKYQTAESLTKEGSGAADIAAIGAGMAMANEISKSLNKEKEEKSASLSTTPPPPPKQKPYFIVKNGKADGPHSLEAIKEMILNGKINKKTYVWQEGMDGWERAGEYLKDLFNSTPPEIPNE